MIFDPGASPIKLDRAAVLAAVRVASPSCPAFVVALGPGAARGWAGAVAAGGGSFATVGGIELLLRRIEDALVLPAAPVVDPAERIAILGDVLRGRPELAASLAADPNGVAATMCGILDELALHGFHRVSAAALAEATAAGLGVVRARLRLLHETLLAFRAEVARRGLERPTRLERATAALAKALRQRLVLVVDGWDRLVPLEREFVLALGAAGAEVRALADAGEVHAAAGTLLGDLLRANPRSVERVSDGSFVRLACRDMQEEAEAAAALVLARLEAGVPRAEIAVQAPTGAGYADLLSRVFAGHGLALAASDRLAAHATPVYQAFRALVRLFYRGPDPFDLATLFAASGSGVRSGRRDAIGRQLLKDMPSSWDDVRACVNKATSAADPPATGEPTRAPDEVARHVEAREAALAVVGVLAQGPSGRAVADPRLAAATLREAVAWFCSGIGNAHRLLGIAALPDRDVLLHRDAASALRGAASLLVERAAAGDLPAAAAFRDAGAFLQAMEALLPDVEDSVAEGATALRLGDEAPGPVDHLVVVGFSRGRWPMAVPASPLLGPLERAALRGLGSGLALLPMPDEVALRHDAEARAAVGQARRSLTVLTPARSEAGDAATPALLLVDLLQRFTDPARLAWRRAAELTYGTEAAAVLAPALGQGPLARGTSRQALRRVARQLGSAAALTPQDRAATVHLARTHGAGPLSAPWLPDLDFELPVRLDVAAREFSASQLEALVSCRYRYFTKYVLGLASLDLARQPRLDVTTTGDIAHHVLEALGENLVAASEKNVRTALASVLGERYPWARHERYRTGVAAVERALLQFVPAYQDLVKGIGWQRGASEVEFGEAVQKPVAFPLDRAQPEALRLIGTDRLRIQGRVDRVDEVAIGGATYRLITDFKYGNVSKFIEQRELGMGLQAALYPHALAALGGPPALGFAYFSLSNRNGNLLPSRSVSLPARLGSSLLDDADLEAFQAKVAELLTSRLALLLGHSLHGGEGDVSPHSVEERKAIEKRKGRSCEYCEVNLLCRFQEVA